MLCNFIFKNCEAICLGEISTLFKWVFFQHCYGRFARSFFGCSEFCGGKPQQGEGLIGKERLGKKIYG